MPDGPEQPTQELLIRRVLPAPRALVFAAFTDPARVAMWWGPHGHTAFSCRFDPRPGGEWRVGMRDPDGKALWTRGVYREVVPPERLVMSFCFEEPSDGLGGETVVTIELTERGAQTELRLHQGVFPTRDSRERHTVGWNDSLDRFEVHVKAEEAG